MPKSEVLVQRACNSFKTKACSKALATVKKKPVASLEQYPAKLSNA